MPIDDVINNEYVPWKPGFMGLGKSRIVRPKGYEEKGLLKRAGKYVAPLVLAASLAACNGEQITPPPPVCEINPAVELAHEYGLPDSIVEAVRSLGNDCVVDEHEHNLITTLLPGILVRSNEVIALSYPERFVGDDGWFDSVEDTVMSRFFLGRFDREGLLVHPGYFELVDKGHVMIPNAYFMSIFEMPFRFDPFPAHDAGGKGLPIVEDGALTSHYNIYNLGRALEGGDIWHKGYSWLEALSDSIVPSPHECVTDHNHASLQIIFNNVYRPFSIDMLEVVNPLPVPVRVTEIRTLYNPPPDGIRNAAMILEPVYWPSSLGHLGLEISFSHLDEWDIESVGLERGDIIPVEGRIGRVDPDFHEWRLIFSYNSDYGYYLAGNADRDSRFKVIDVFHPSPYDPDKRGRVWPVFYESVTPIGIPTVEFLGVHNSVCNFIIDNELYWGRHPDIGPMRFYYPEDTLVR
jgi:hypothetical protein